METDCYKTLKGKSEAVYKEKGSKFIALAFHVETEEECKEILQEVKKEYYDARHHCYAYRIDPEDIKFRSNDDGEPSGSAGKPILNQILSFELHNTLVIVVRYFGGTKLGVSGLINAYKTSTREAFETAHIVNSYITSEFEILFAYPLMNDVMRIIKEEKLKILKQDFTTTCVIKIVIKKSLVNRVVFRFENIRGLEINPLENNKIGV